MNTLWFINPEPDFEREQWTLFAYLRDAKIDLSENKLEPFYSDIKRRIQDIECFLATRTTVQPLTQKEKDTLAVFNKRFDDEDEYQEVFKIAKWALKKLQNMRKKYNKVWRSIEASFNIFYIGEKPTFKINHGILFVRYAGSSVTEVYKFWKEGEKVLLSHIEYTEDDYADIKGRLNEYLGDAFIIAESLSSFDTMTTTMPFLIETLRNVMK